MKKLAIILLSVLVAGLFVACNQEVTIDAQTYANMELGTFVLNGKNYATLQAAIDALSSKAVGDNDGVIYLTRDFSGPGAVIEGKNVKIDFGANKYTFTNVTATQGSTSGTFGLKIKGGSSVTLAGTKSMDLFDSTTGLTMVYVEGAGTSLAVEQAPQMSVADDQFVFWAADGATLTIGGETKVSGSIAATGTSTFIVTESAAIAVPEMKTENAAVLLNTSGYTAVTKISATDTTVVVTGTGDVNVATAGTSDGLTVQNLSDKDVSIGGTDVAGGKKTTVKYGDDWETTSADADAAEEIIKDLPIFESGTGTKTDPYIIKTAAQLELFRDSVNFGNTYAGEFIRLDSDITLSGVWTPIGAGGYRVISPASPFSGTFDGNNYEIKGLSSKGYNPPATIEYKEGKEGRYSYGLFGYVKDSTIMNVILSDVDIDVATGDSIGALIGYSSGNLTVDNCDVISGSVTGYDAVAGVVGRAYGNVDNTIISIEKSSNSAKITGSEKVAGIVGHVAGNAKPYTASIDNNVNNGEVHGYGSVSFVSGIVNYGYWNGAKDTVIITNNANNGLIKQDTAHNIAYIANGASDGPEESIDIYDFRGNTNSGNNEIENLKDVDWYKNKEHEVVLVINGQRPIVYYEYPTVYTEPSGTGINYGESNGRHCEEVIVSNGTETLKFSLDGFAAKVNSGTTFKDYTATLKEDIALYTRWTPIGNSYRGQSGGAYFAGTFDGNKKTISGLTNDGITPVVEDEKATHKEYVYGLFGVVKGATIKDLTLTNVSIVNRDEYEGTSVGAVVGYSEGSLTLTGCVVGAADKGDKSSIVGNTVGGIIGRAYGTARNSQISITGCENYASVTANVADDQAKTKAAGIVGFVTCTAGDSEEKPSVTISGNKNYGAINSNCTVHSIISGVAVYGFNNGTAIASFRFDNNENHGELTVAANPFAAFIACQCNNGMKSGDELTAAGNTNDGSITGFENCNLVVATQSGTPEWNDKIEEPK